MRCARRPGSGRVAAATQRAGCGHYSRAIMRLLFVLDQWPELSETFVVNELQALRRLGHEVRVEAGRVADHPNPEAPHDVDVTLLGDEGRRRGLVDLLWLAARRPLACMRDVARRRRWLRDEWARPLRRLAPAARRVLERGDEHLHAHFAAGAGLDALRLAALTGAPVQRHGACLRHLHDAAQP